MAGRHSFAELRARMTPDGRAASEAAAVQLDAEMGAGDDEAVDGGARPDCRDQSGLRRQDREQPRPPTATSFKIAVGPERPSR